MGKKITYERWINLYLPDNWNEREEMGYVVLEKEEPTHWRIWFLVDKTRALMAAYISDPGHDVPHLEEAVSIVADIEFISLLDNDADGGSLSNMDDDATIESIAHTDDYPFLYLYPPYL